MTAPTPTPRPADERRRAPAKDRLDRDPVDLASDDSFPASDPPSSTPLTHSGPPKRKPSVRGAPGGPPPRNR